MSIIAWEVSKYSDEPKRMEYARETAAFYVSSKGRRDAKSTSYSRLYADYDEACAAIKARQDSDEEAKRRELVRKAAPELLEALELADAALSGANMDMKVVERKVKAAIAKSKGEQQ